jgi:hypothetical protein
MSTHSARFVVFTTRVSHAFGSCPAEKFCTAERRPAVACYCRRLRSTTIGDQFACFLSGSVSGSSRPDSYLVSGSSEIVAENLFLRRQLALYQERKGPRRRPTPAAKLVLVALAGSSHGNKHWRLSGRAHSCVGIEPDFDCSGGGNIERSDAHHCLRISVRSSSQWPKRIRVGVERRIAERTVAQAGHLR